MLVTAELPRRHARGRRGTQRGPSGPPGRIADTPRSAARSARARQLTPQAVEREPAIRTSLPQLAAACAALCIAPASAAAQPGDALNGGTGFGEPALTAAPALVGQQQRASGTLGSRAARATVVVQARRGTGEWTTIAAARAGEDGSFQASWRAAATGRWTIRAVPAGGALAAAATPAPSATATVYRSATATWYSLPGNRTACGVRLRRSTIGVAHRSLPCGTQVDVAWGGRTLRVPVIDRGPFVAGVHYDLTLAAARALGFVSAGRVRVGVLPAGPTVTPSPIAAPAP